MQSSKGYGQVSAMAQSSPDRPKKTKRFALIGGSAIILVAMVVAVAVGVSRRNNGTSSGPDGSSDELQTSVKAIKSICQPTDYKEACENTLSEAAGNITDPKELIRLSFKVAMDYVRKVFEHSTVLAAAEKDPRTSHALENCKELLDYAIDDLNNSFDQLGELDISKIHKAVDNLKIWLSAAMTYQETCLDGFDENTTGNAGESMRNAMRNAMKSSAELTSNTLAIVNEISSVLASFKIPFFNRRRLLLSEEELSSDGFPSWVSVGRRRLLTDDLEVISPNLTVAQDGSGDYKTINEALVAVPKNSKETFLIYIMEGVYKEVVQINRSMTNLVLIGAGPTLTKITGNLNCIDGTQTFKTATVAVIGDGFAAKDIWFENSAGPEKHQAVALRVQSDMAVFYNCRMDGYQDTLYVHTKRQFYSECTISGTIDFIFGNAASVFQNCVMLVRKPMDNQQNIVTAQGRNDWREPTAIVLHNCTITSDPAYYPFRDKIPAYLGRPWKEYSRTLIMQCQIDDLIRPQGWLPWVGDFALETCFYTEFDNYGPGAGVTERVKWKGVKQIDWEQAELFTVEQFIQGEQWINATGVPYIPGLLPVNSTERIH